MFKSLGLAVEDLAAAEYVLRRAEAENVGHGRLAVIRGRRDRPRARGARRHRRSARRSCGSTSSRDAEIWLKLELLQPVRSFKIRGAGNAILQATDAELADGVLTASAGNMAQGVAYAARLRGVPATIVVPEHAPQTKIDAIERYGGTRDQGAVRGVVAGARDRPLRGSRRALRPPGRQPDA